jgi:hypothetical protein
MLYIDENDLLQMRYHGEAGGDVLIMAKELGYPVNRKLVQRLFEELIYIQGFHRIFKVNFRVERGSEKDIGAKIRRTVRELYTPDSFLGTAIAYYYYEDPRTLQHTKELDDFVMKQVKLPFWMATLVERTEIAKVTNSDDLDKIRLRKIDEKRKKKAVFST